MTRRLVVVGISNDERNVALARALARAGAPALVTIDWRDVIADAGVLRRRGRPGDLLRVESPGSDAEVWYLLAGRGGSTQRIAHGEWRPGRAWFAGLSSVLADVDAASTHFTATQRTVDLLAMIDKLVCDERLRAARVPVPETFEAPSTVAALRAELARRRMHAVYVKPRWGSSGAGVLAYRWRTDRELLVATARVENNGRIYNVKGLVTHTTRETIDRLLAAVIEDGAIVQRWIPKAGTDGGPFDLRVIAIGGRIAHRVARVGRGTMTNLHLGATRHDPDAALAPYGDRAREAVDEACLRAAGAFDRRAVLGIDVMLDPSGHPWVLECNAWGDLLRRTTVDGLDTYDVQVRTLFRSAA